MNTFFGGRKALSRLALAAGLLTAVCFTSCKKTALDQHASNAQAKKSTVAKADIHISMDEVYAALPQTIMHNLSGKFKIDAGRAEWIYEADYVLVRIPLNDAVNRSYLYAAKYYNDPMGKPRVFLSQFMPDRGSDLKDFSGKQLWLNLQDWTFYGVQFEHNKPVGYMQPETINPGWEAEMLDAGVFYLDANDKIVTDPVAMQILQKRRGPLKCPDNVNKGKGGGFFDWVGGIFDNIAEGIRDWWKDSGEPNPSGSGDIGWVSGWPAPGDGTGLPGGDGGTYGGGWSNGPGTPDNNPNIDIWGHLDESTWASADESISGPIVPGMGNLGNATVDYLVFTLDLNAQQAAWLLAHNERAHDLKVYMLKAIPGLTFEQKKAIVLKHLQMMRDNPGYLDFVNNFDQEYPIGKSILELADYTFTPQAPEHPITNKNDYLKCFSNVPGATYKVTLAVDQPVPHTRKAFKLGGNGKACDVGHTFLILEQNINGVKTVRSIGWYPQGPATPVNPVDPAMLGNDAGHDYDIALVNSMNGTYFMQIVNAIKNDSHQNYDLNNYNCTTWAYNKILMRPVDNVGATEDFWPLGYGMNPGDMGEDIRPGNITLHNYQSSLTDGQAPSNQGTCP